MYRIIQLGSTAVGVCTKEGVILAVEKRISSSLLEPSRYDGVNGQPIAGSSVLIRLIHSFMHTSIASNPTQPTHLLSVEKIMEIDTHIGAAMSGLMPDARTLVDHARVSFDATLVCMHSLDHSTRSRSALFLVDVDPTVSPHHYPIHRLAIPAGGGAEPPLLVQRAHPGGGPDAGHLRPRPQLRRGPY